MDVGVIERDKDTLVISNVIFGVAIAILIAYSSMRMFLVITSIIVIKSTTIYDDCYLHLSCILPIYFLKLDVRMSLLITDSDDSDSWYLFFTADTARPGWFLAVAGRKQWFDVDFCT